MNMYQQYLNYAFVFILELLSLLYIHPSTAAKEEHITLFIYIYIFSLYMLHIYPIYMSYMYQGDFSWRKSK